eukprot:6181649-Pleurochrysis_carterae.AAC.2
MILLGTKASKNEADPVQSRKEVYVTGCSRFLYAKAVRGFCSPANCESVTKWHVRNYYGFSSKRSWLVDHIGGHEVRMCRGPGRYCALAAHKTVECSQIIHPVARA